MAKGFTFFEEKGKTSEQRGFTMIELLIVVTILAILTLIGIAAFRGVQQSARDALRQSDLRSIQSALEQYYSDQLFYPTTTGGQGSPCNNVAGSLKIGCPLYDPTGNRTYFNPIPDDPLTARHYQYDAKPGSPIQCENSLTNKCISYCLSADMENTSPALGCASGNYDFGISPP